MADGPKIGIAIIARDEEARLPRLLASISGAFDYAVLLDTGSKDKTVAVFQQWCERERAEFNARFDWRIDSFTWRDDFAAARTRADELLESWPDCAFRSWADCDDSLTGAERLRALAAGAGPEVAAFVFDYAYAHDAHGNVTCRLKRERLVRAGASTWAGRIHEAQLLQGPAVFAGPEICEWVHHPAAEGRDPDRNLKILRRWLRDEPHNPRVLAYMGTETLARMKVKQALGYFRRYLREQTGWDEERAQVHRKLSQAFLVAGDLERAERSAYEALRVMPQWPDSYLTLAEVAYNRREWRNAGDWAKRVLELGVPDTLLIINPLDYALSPRIIMAGAMGALGRLEPAIATAEEVLGLVPDHAEVARTTFLWRSQLKREQAAQRAVSDAQILVAHDEQWKALILLEQCVPHFAQDHPEVVAVRSQLRERLRFVTDPALYAQHYETGGSAPEDFNDDVRSLEIAEHLPRCHFLLDGLTEQMAIAA
jgi:tetratricopeptide (TPR) repeat protein